MTDNKADKKLNEWTDYFIDGIPWFFGMMFIIWLIAGILPFVVSRYSVETSGQIGDMFGMANSLFSGFAFAVAMLALVMQIRETREAGERHAEESRLANENIQRQLKQEELQTRQMELAERTAEIQHATMTNEIRQRKEALLVEILDVVGTMNVKLMVYRGRASDAMKEPQEHMVEKRNAALNDVLISFAKIGAMRGAALINFGGASAALREVFSGWTQFFASVRPQAGPPIPFAEFEKQSNELLKRTVNEVGVLHQKLLDGVA